MKSAIVCAVVLLASTTLCAQSNPVPLVNNPIVPSSALPGGASFTLTVNGTGFVAGSTVNWNGAALPTTFVSGSQLTASVPAANIALAGTGSVTVVSPAPGGGTSNVAYFAVRKPFPAVSFGDTQLPAAKGAGLPVAADFNGDGKLDLALIASEESAVSVMLGNGDGSFGRPTKYTVGSAPYRLIANDFNGDRKLDLTVYDFNGSVSVLLGNGDGTFQNRLDSPSVIEGLAAISGDFRGDGKLDLAIVMEFGQVAVMLGNGDGTFQAPVLYTLGSSAASVAAGDFNRDGKLDLAVTGVAQGAGVVAIFLGNGDGTFQPAVDISAGGFKGEDLVAGDFNGDGKLDLAVKTQPINVDTGLAVLLGNGDGSFEAPIDTPSTTDTHMSAADLNGDGKLDLIVPTFQKTQVLLGTGDGHLGPLGLFPSSKFPAGTAFGDFNGDGLADIVVANADINSTVYVLPQLTSVLSSTLTYFGSVKLGKSKTLQVTLMNYGDKVLTIDRIGVQGDDASVFSETNTCGSGVQPGASCKIAISFTPQLPRKYTMARVAIQDSATRLSQKIMLEGMGLK